MEKLRSSVRVGDRVRVRRQRWQVADVRPCEGCHLLTLRGTGTLNFGVTRRVIAPFDTVEAIDRPSTITRVGLRRWRRACRALLATHGSTDMLRTARHARIDLLPHQLEPAIAIVRGLGCRVLIADEVGLGKTIQAGLIMSELRARGAADRILVLAPAALRDQWAGELADRFGLAPVIVDMASARRRAAQLPVGVNPWATLSIAVSSFDYVKRPEVLPALTSCHWDVVVVDEVHGVTPGSDRRSAVEAICGRTPYVVLLTATPHNGDRAAFEALCDLGAQENDRLLVFRRSRHEIALGSGRRVHRVFVRPSVAERRMHTHLSSFTRAIAAGGHDRNRDVRLPLTILHKRSLSSARSLEQSIARRLSTITADPGDGLQQPGLPLDDPGGELDARDQPPHWAIPTLMDDATERGLLQSLGQAARAAAINETKLARLNRLLCRLRRLHESAIVFTEYRDTLVHVRRALGFECAVLHGGLTPDERRSELESFSTGRRTVLLATDAAGEGLNLHHGCRVVINLELPWNPMRLEQRIGRVDRIGQRRRVHVFHLIARETGETRILEYLKNRITAARADIATADPLGGFDDDDEQAIAGMVVGAELENSVLCPSPVGPSFPPPLAGMLASFGGRAEALAKAGSSGATPDLKGRAYTPAASTTRLLLNPALAREAALERGRLVQARAFSAADDERIVDDLIGTRLAAIARRAGVRRKLGARSLAVLQTRAEDACGRMVASRLLPVLIETSPPVDRRLRTLWMLELTQSIEKLMRDRTAREEGTWGDEARGFHDAFWTTRRRREMAIAEGGVNGETELIQAGLFDLRALRAHADFATRARERGAESARRIAAASPDALHVRPPQAVLLLFPPR
jgi:superfamily II DNA or RNA helicase